MLGMTIWKFTSKSINLLPLFKNLLKFRAPHGRTRTFSVRADFAELARVCLQHSGDNRFIVYANPLGISLLSMTNCRPGFSGTPNMDRGREKSFWISDVWIKWKFSLVLKVQLSSGMESHNLSGKYWIWKSASPCVGYRATTTMMIWSAIEWQGVIVGLSARLDSSM